MKTDTVFRTDTIHTGEVRSDTAFLFSHSRDTVVVDRGRLQMKYYYSHDTVFLSGKCRDSVIIKQYPVEVTTYKQEEKKGKAAWYEVNWWKIAAFLLLIALIFHILRK